MFQAAAIPRRSRRSLVLSLLLHVGVVVLANLATNNPAVSHPDSLIFVASHVPARAPLILSTPEPVAEARPEPEPLIAPDLPKSEVELAVSAPEPGSEPAPAPEREVAALPEPPPAAEPELPVAGRQGAATAPAGEVVDSGFDQEVAQAPPLMERKPVVGVLDAPSNTQRPGPGRLTATVTSTGFDRSTRESAPARPPQDVVTGLAGFDANTEAAGSALGASQEVVTGVAGFGTRAAPEAEPPPSAPAAMASGFEADLPDVPAPEAAAPRGPPDSPVEVEFKPTPEYSAEARAARIEGNVLLEVEFSAAGTVRVLRVVEGLGYGLDALAVRAAEQMRFTPAVRNGRRVDTRSVVSIVFRLA
ncbi:MAG: TonB family protein [Acidobacteria bacterium]|nr:TonB family protein [Acidobacteriota bacterium]MYA46762.1 TonB family protein [Acidobacteriota bacterium]MYI37669.1 TonB family protein [Acidobacteriota bacterium]